MCGTIWTEAEASGEGRHEERRARRASRREDGPTAARGSRCLRLALGHCRFGGARVGLGGRVPPMERRRFPFSALVRRSQEYIRRLQYDCSHLLIYQQVLRSTIHRLNPALGGRHAEAAHRGDQR